ncbi:MBL fold metallo-hydrolase [Salinispora vitiensis]|uniref:MBL fold metallo-hydrolase n=1 Tax=Salinispora vitiensis TaxID=999544 RepID=UPI000370C7A6|nr:MBL fold metallo-hydrolase [Salinispora vitiensis]
MFGNADFAPATVVAHHQTGSDMMEAGLSLCRLWPDVQWGDIRLAPPEVTFTDRMTLTAGRLTAELIHVGPAHTASDVVVWVPQRRVLFTGDVAWSAVTPYVLMGSVDGSLQALELMRRLRPAVVVAGHGRVGGSEVLDFTEAYLRRVQDLARTGLREGLSVPQVAQAADPGPFGALPECERLVSNLHRSYAELQGLPPGGRIDVAGSFREMVAFHGAAPHCAA